LHLFNLLGDPLLRMRHPSELTVTAPEQAAPGETITVRGTSPIAGAATIELVVRRDRFTCTLPDCDPADRSPSAERTRIDTYRRANDPRLFAVSQDLPAGEFTVSVPVPDTARGDCHVRVYVEGTGDFALGSADVRVRSVARTK